MKKILILFFVFFINSLLVFSQNEIYDSSNVFEYQTPPLSSTYSLNCNIENLRNIRIAWQGEAYAVHKLILSYKVVGEVISPTSTTLLETNYIQPNTATSGSYLHLNVGSNKIEYTLKVDYQDQSFVDQELKTICQAAEYLIPPSNLEVYPVSKNTLHITWQDNVTTTDDYGYLIKRLKLTPDRPYDVKVNLLPDNKIRISWKNNTFSNNENGPFYHAISLCNSNGCKEINILDYNQTSFSTTTDNGGYNSLNVKACSRVKLDINFDRNLDLICSEEVSPDTLPTLSKSRFQFLSNILNIFNEFLKGLKGIFKEAEGQESYDIDINPYFNNSPVEIKLTNTPFGVYQDTNLNENTVYYYRLQACKVIKEGNNVIFTNVCSSAIYGGAKTTSGTTNKKIKLCTQNSRCEEVNGSGGGDLPNQCVTNNDCKDVGKSKRLYQER